MHTPIPLFLSVGVGVQFRICPKHQFWGVLWGLWAVFWLFVGKHMALHKFGSQSILRLQNRGVGFVVGLDFPVGGVWWGVGSLGLTVGNCGKGLPKVLQQLRRGFACKGSLSLLGLLPCLVWVRPAVLCKWLPVGCPSWVLVLVDGAGVPSVLLSVSGCPFFLGCCVRVAPVALSAFPGRWPHLVGVFFGVGGLSRLCTNSCIIA